MGCGESKAVGAYPSLPPAAAARCKAADGRIDLCQPEEGHGAPKFSVLSMFPFEALRQPMVRELRLARNEITDLPDAISSLIHLELLDLSDNRLAGLPSSFGSLTKLQDLDASGVSLAERSDRGGLPRG